MSTIIKDYIEIAVHHDKNEVLSFTNINDKEFVFEWDEFRVGANGDMLPPEVYNVPAGITIQFPKFMAINAALKLGKDMAYANFGDKGISNKGIWLPLAEQCVSRLGKAKQVKEEKETKEEKPKTQVEAVSEDGLDEMSWNDIRAKAKEKNIKVFGKSREKVINELRNENSK